jgi:hypothetical protein
MSCDRKFWCHAQAKARASAGHAHTTKALAVPPALAAMGYEPANGGWQLRPGTAHCSCVLDAADQRIWNVVFVLLLAAPVESRLR